MRITSLFLFLGLWGLPGTAIADQNDPRLDTLFEQLHAAPGPEATREIESEIWVLWLSSHDELSNTLMQRGLAAMRHRRFDLALEHFSDLVAHESSFAEAWNKRATVLYGLGKFQASIADIKKTLSLEPRHFGALAGLGMCYEALGDESAALKAYQLAVKANPHLPTIRKRIKALEREIQRRNI